MKYLHIIFVLLFFNKLQAQIDNEGSFMPTPGKYIVSGWVKEAIPKQQVGYTDSSIKVIFGDANYPPLYTIYLKPSGTIIDGWQRILGMVVIPVFGLELKEPNIKIELICSSTSVDCYFDDIRFFPYNGNLKSFVYDEDTQQLMAELDENNYATFYEYDIEGGLVRVKKETEKGVFTIQETRSNSYKR